MKDGTFVLDAHTGYWDASAENVKNRFGDAFNDLENGRLPGASAILIPG